MKWGHSVRVYGQDVERLDGFKVPLQVHLGSGTPTGYGEIPGVSPPCHTPLKCNCSSNFQEQEGWGWWEEWNPTPASEQQKESISNITLGGWPHPDREAAASPASL